MKPVEVQLEKATDRFLKLTAIPGKSGEEKEVAEAIVDILLDAGLDRECITFDEAHKSTRIAGNCGNLIVRLPGKGEGPRTLLSAHMDTVPICLGAEPIVEGGEVRSRGQTGLGADNRSGCAAILTAAVERLTGPKKRLPPAVLLFTVQEEVGLEGARHLDRSKIGEVDRAFNFDGGVVEKVTTGAIGGERMELRVTGIPSHAGAAPEQGVSAIVIASRAIAELYESGWLGKIEKAEGVGTANVGVIHGGLATNVITEEVTLRAEARSHDAAMRERIVFQIRSAFERATEATANVNGQHGKCEFASRVDYESFSLPEDDPSIACLEATLRELGRTPYRAVVDGGLDANWLNLHGIPAVTVGCGQRNIHTAEERLNLPDYHDACRIATQMICTVEDE
jgi:tripeptide aminopeptidase